MSYVRDVAALARKDLLLELRARDTLPAMLLFVAAVFVIFHFALPGTPTRLETTGFLWVAILFTALLPLGRAFVPEREQRTFLVSTHDPGRVKPFASGRLALA